MYQILLNVTSLLQAFSPEVHPLHPTPSLPWCSVLFLFLKASEICRVKSTWHAFQKIVKAGGVRGLWKGWVPNVQRAALVNMGGMYSTVYHLALDPHFSRQQRLTIIVSREWYQYSIR